MNVVNSGARFQIFGEDLRTFHTLPVGSYEVCFHPQQGFWLQSRPDLVIGEEKVYGSHHKRVEKVLGAFESSNRNLGVILSGKKGIGKSLFARVLADEANTKDIPLVIVSNYAPGITNFIASIEQEVVVLFDEFEKTFGERDDFEPQEELLSLFDGLDVSKKLFVITCNEVNRLNDYLLNRPGRFHYHFILSTPTPEEIREYMSDKLQKEYYDAIEDIVNFSLFSTVTYDYLRAFAFELNRGYSFAETVADLNISKERDLMFTCSIELENGTIFESRAETIDLCRNGYDYTWFLFEGVPVFKMDFIPRKINVKNGRLTIDLSNVNFELHQERGNKLPRNLAELIIGKKVKSIIFNKAPDALNAYLY